MDLKKAAFINAVGKYSVVVIQLAVNAILSRILSPEDYGILAVVTVFTTFFSTLSNMGFGTAIIQNKSLNKKDIDHIYSFSLYVAFFLSVVFALFSFVIAWFYKDGIYIPVAMLLSISLFFGTLNMVPSGVLNREKKFVSIAFRTVIVYTSSAIIAVILACAGFRYYALVIQTILASILTFLWNYLSVRPHFHFRIDKSSIQKIANYSGFQFAFNFVNYFAANLDNLLTGKIFGNADLGYYNKAYSLTLYPVNNLSGVISPVLHPILSDYQAEKNIIYKKYLDIIRLLMLIGCYIEAVCILSAREIIYIISGPQWTKSVICFQMLAFCIVFRMINASSGAIFQSLGNTKLLFCNGLLNTCISVIAILIGVLGFGDIKGLSVCVGIAYIIHYLTASTMLIKMGFRYSLIKYYKDLMSEFLIFLVLITTASFWLHMNVFAGINLYLSLFMKAGILTVLYLVLLVITKKYKVFLALIKSKAQ